MPRLTPEEMNKISLEKKQRRDALDELLKMPFELHNAHQLKALQSYLNHFEFSVHKMYIFQSLSELMKIWGGSWVWALVLPIPEFVGTFLNYTLYLGLTGLAFEHFSMNNFHEELKDMQTLYNWVLKEGALEYSDHINNEEKLLHQDIQRMIELIAPLLMTDAAVAWPKVIKEDIPSSQWRIVSAYQYGISFFAGSDGIKETPAKAKRLALKERVERDEMRVSVVEGLKKASEYFITNPNFKKIASEEAIRLCQKPLQMLREAAPQILARVQDSHAHLH